MVSTMQQLEHKQCASHAVCSALTLAVAAVLCAVKGAAVDLLQTACRALAESVCRSTTALQPNTHH